MIEIKNLTKKYNNSLILNNTSFTFSPKGLTCLLGASGSGKSTLLNMLAGFDSDYSGEITAWDTLISNMSSDDLCAYRRDNIGFVFQDYHLLKGYTVLENILLSCELNGLSSEENTNCAKELLNKVSLCEKANEKIENLSGGQKQRVAIVRALIGNPKIVLADEPTGSLDRSNSNEIMALLKDIAKDRLVVVITHDEKICSFSDNIVHIENGKIISENKAHKTSINQSKSITVNTSAKVSSLKLALKNFKVHIKGYLAISLAISIGILSFMLSLSSNNIMEKSIFDFKEKNTAFNNGYIKTEDNAGEILRLLKNDNRIENVYYQHKISNVTLNIDNKTETMAEKYPMPKATENMSYGIMPKFGAKEISLSPSLAKKFKSDISNLIGKELRLTYGGKEYNLTISGIFNAGYDDFFVSSDIEQDFYKDINSNKINSISYDVKNFEDIASVSQMLVSKNITSNTAAKEVSALQSTFENLSRLFLLVSILILAIGLFISIILLVKLQNSRYKEIGLLSALGFSRGTIRAVIVNENILLSAMAAVFNAIFIGTIYLVSITFKLSLIVTIPQILLSILGTGIVVIFISIIANHKLINTEPAEALRK